MTKKFDQFDRLQVPGQHVMVPGVRPMQVSKLAKANVRRRLGPRSVVVTAYIPEVDSTFVALAYVPTDLEPRPKDQAPEPAELYRGPGELSDEDRRRMLAVTTSRIRARDEEPEDDEQDEHDGSEGVL